MTYLKALDYSQSEDFYNQLDQQIQLTNENKSALEETVKVVLDDFRKSDRLERLLFYTKKFDQVDLKADQVFVPTSSIKNSESELQVVEKIAIDTAIQNIRSYHSNQKMASFTHAGQYGEKLEQHVLPIERVGVYVPGGIAGMTPLVSSLLMNVIPAQIAGCQDIVVSSPPRSDGNVHPALRYACSKLGIDKLLLAGGVQAIASFSYGLPTLQKRDIIVGPGNAYVTEAKRQVIGEVQIDGIFGHSEIVVVADKSAKADHIAADLLSQCEHAGAELAVLISTEQNLIDEVNKALVLEIQKLERSEAILSSLKSRGTSVLVPDLKTAINVSNHIAPEHLELQISNPRDLLASVTNAGAVFLGHLAPEPIGDYIAGTNHVLPTGGSARFTSPLSVYTFLKRICVIDYSQEAFDKYAQHAVELAKIEGLTAHANAITKRFKP